MSIRIWGEFAHATPAPKSVIQINRFTAISSNAEEKAGGISSNDLEKTGQKNNSKEQDQNSLLYFFIIFQDFTAHSCLLQIWQMAVCPREKSPSPRTNRV